MQNIFPFPEEIEYEEIYGQTRPDAHPHTQQTTHNLHDTRTDAQTVNMLVPSYTKWFSFTTTHPIEHQAFPELKKDISISKMYIQWRNTLITTYQQHPSKYLTITHSRKSVSCDLHMLIRIHSFLEKYGLINYKIEIRSTLKQREEIKRIKFETQIDSLGPPLIIKGVNNNDHITNNNGANHTVINTNNNINMGNHNTPLSSELNFENMKCKCGGNLTDCYFCSDLNIFICNTCYENGKYPVECVSSMFVKYGKGVLEQVWTEREELSLLEGIDKYGDDWSGVSRYVGTKTKEQCVLHFLKMPISDDIIFKNIEMCKDVPLSTSTNPIMSVIAFICSCVHPNVASEASKWAIQKFSNDIEKMTGVILGVAGVKALEQKSVEEKKVERLLQVLVESQIKKMELKMDDFKVLCGVVEKERSDLNRARENYRKEIEAIKEKIVGMRRGC